MIKNILIYLAVLVSAFVFNVFFYAWFSWYLLVLTLCVPLLSLLISLPFMIFTAVKGISVFTQKELTAEEPLSISITTRKSKNLFCPLIKIKFKSHNRFAKQKKSLKFLYGGLITDSINIKTSSITHNCGSLEINAKYFKVYDLLGIFFIPARLNCHAVVFINPKPKQVSVLPNNMQNKIIGYKPKSNGFAEEYELRSYQQGDTLKNIHWKISARHNELIVKEPSTPIYRPLVLTPIITSNPSENNVTLGKLVCLASSLNKKKSEFYCTLPSGEVCEIYSENDFKRYLLRLYNGDDSQDYLQFPDNPITCTITHNTEAVSE